MHRSASLPKVAILALGLVLGCATRTPPGDQGLSDRIADLVRRAPDTPLNFATLAPFHWTRLYIFVPYTTKATAEQTLGFDWPYAWGAIEGRDDRALLVFVDSARVMAAFEQTIDQGNFTSAARSAGYPPDSATFRFQHQGQLSNGAPNVVAVWQP